MSNQNWGFEMLEEPIFERNKQTEGNSLEDLRNQPHIEIYEKHAVLTGEGNIVARIWAEGKQSEKAQERYQRVKKALEEGSLAQKIEEARSPDLTPIIEVKLPTEQIKAIEEIFSSVTAQSGRALVDIFVLQLVVKVICPEQDVRLHKGSKNSSAFSWKEGISMRSIDASYIGPSLRQYDLLRMNQYGAFMSRSFAENYPYTRFYKAEIQGAKQRGKQRWLQIIDELENGKSDAEIVLLYVLQLLWKSSEAFNTLVQETLQKLEAWMNRHQQLTISRVSAFIKEHVERSEARARLLEVAIHSLLQALDELMVDLGGKLKPLMPMRTANLKHGNVGDVEVLAGDLPVEAWDAKYDQPYLSDALDELEEKIRRMDVSDLQFGYVLLPTKKKYLEVDRKVDEINERFGLKVQILSFDEWVNEQTVRCLNTSISEESLAKAWLKAYAESLCQKRRNKAPIDEPTFDWVVSLRETLA